MTLEPNGLLFLALLVGGFGGLLFALARFRQVAFKIVAGVLALALGALFGIGLVNRHYAYYTSWGSLYAAMTDSGAVSVSSLPARLTPTLSAPIDRSGHALPALPGQAAHRSPATAATKLTASRYAGHGTVVKLDLAGAKSGLNRSGYVYLPPQYLDPKYADMKFPVAELLHGDPGDPGSWVYGLSVAKVLDSEINHGTIGPMVVVMPATYTGARGQECIDAVVGDADDTYLTLDVPADITAQFRVAEPGAGWAVGGLSDGGFCAANLALRHPGTFAAAAVMDGYFAPAAPPRERQRLFGGDQSRAAANDPTLQVQDTNRRLPRFWIMAGTRNYSDVSAAKAFAQRVRAREPATVLSVVGGDHTAPAWRTATPAMLQWMWQVLTGGHVATGDVQLPVEN